MVKKIGLMAQKLFLLIIVITMPSWLLAGGCCSKPQKKKKISENQHSQLVENSNEISEPDHFTKKINEFDEKIKELAKAQTDITQELQKTISSSSKMHGNMQEIQNNLKDLTNVVTTHGDTLNRLMTLIEKNQPSNTSNLLPLVTSLASAIDGHQYILNTIINSMDPKQHENYLKLLKKDKSGDKKNN